MIVPFAAPRLSFCLLLVKTDDSLEFSEFSKQEVCNPLVFHDDFESFDWTLISLRSLLFALGGTGGDGLLPKSL